MRCLVNCWPDSAEHYSCSSPAPVFCLFFPAKRTCPCPEEHQLEPLQQVPSSCYKALFQGAHRLAPSATKLHCIKSLFFSSPYSSHLGSYVNGYIPHCSRVEDFQCRPQLTASAAKTCVVCKIPIPLLLLLTRTLFLLLE